MNRLPEIHDVHGFAESVNSLRQYSESCRREQTLTADHGEREAINDVAEGDHPILD